MKAIPIHIVTNRITRLPLAHQIAHLRALVAAEPPRSIRRGELESLLKDKVTRQLKKESRAA
jgi:hypothetical protein